MTMKNIETRTSSCFTQKDTKFRVDLQNNVRTRVCLLQNYEITFNPNPEKISFVYTLQNISTENVDRVK